MDALELGPDGKEWAKTAAGYRHVESVMREAFDGASPIGGWVWHGHSVREAFVAGAEWQESRADLHRTALDAEKARADAAEAALKTAREALAGMLAVFSPYPREDTEGWREEHEACKAADFALALIKEPRT